MCVPATHPPPRRACVAQNALGAQRLHTDAHNTVRRSRPRSKNNWEQAMTYMAGLLDALPPAAPPAAPTDGSGSPEPPSHTQPLNWVRAPFSAFRSWLDARAAAASGSGGGRVGVVHALPPSRLYDKPLHMPVLFSRAVLMEMEARRRIGLGV